MSLKKAACALLSLSVVLGGGFVCKNSVQAAKTATIIKKLGDKYPLDSSDWDLITSQRVLNILEAVKGFIQEETTRVKPLRDRLTREEKKEQNQRIDSLAFCYFCCLCFAANEGDDVVQSLPNDENVVRSRKEHTEDCKVIRDTFLKMTFTDFKIYFEKYFKVDFSKDVCLKLRDYISRWQDPMKSSEKGEKTLLTRGRQEPSRKIWEYFGGESDSDGDVEI